MSFSELNISKQLLSALSDLGFSKATPIQSAAFPIIMSGADAVGIAQTGTGKTFAYLLPSLRQLNFSQQKAPRIIIIVPTRELVIQVINECEKLCKYQTVRIGGIYGGANINTQRQLLFNGLDVLVATPGRLLDMILDRALIVTSLQKLIIDEVDEMLSLGFRPQLIKVLELLPLKKQNILFSATLTEEIESIINQFFKSPNYIEINKRGTPIDKIKQVVYTVPNFYTKVNLLEYLLLNNTQINKCIVFCKDKLMADEVYKELLPVFTNKLGIIHSNKSQPQRFEAIANFEKGIHQILIATDVISRGLDLTEVSHVINFDTPFTPEDYIHRIGRTGRADKSGNSITFVSKDEKAALKNIETLMKKKIDVLEMPETVEITDALVKWEKKSKPDKNLKKLPKVELKTGAFHEKKAKNKKIQLGGKRKQESLRRKREIQRKKRGI
jgi:ATP-dependent RNA helicase RhlE